MRAYSIQPLVYSDERFAARRQPLEPRVACLPVLAGRGRRRFGLERITAHHRLIAARRVCMPAELVQTSRHAILRAGRDRMLTDSQSHGGFNNDPKTITTIMRRITGNDSIAELPADALTGY